MLDRSKHCEEKQGKKRHQKASLKVTFEQRHRQAVHIFPAGEVSEHQGLGVRCHLVSLRYIQEACVAGAELVWATLEFLFTKRKETRNIRFAAWESGQGWLEIRSLAWRIFCLRHWLDILVSRFWMGRWIGVWRSLG